MKFNTTSYKCNETNTVIGYSTKTQLPESIVRTIEGETITLWKQ